MPVSIEEIQAKFPELALRLRSGNEVVITKDGQPYIKLVAQAVMPAGPRLGSVQGGHVGGGR